MLISLRKRICSEPAPFVKPINLAEMLPLIEEVLANGGTFSLTVTGGSMYPFLTGGRDRVTLSPVPQRLRRNDLPLYRRSDGALVLHRIVKIGRDGTYAACGDHQWVPERGLRHEQMLALATQYVRKGRHLTDRNILYRLYRTLWTWLLPLRPCIFFLRGLAGRLHRKFFWKQRPPY